MTTPPTAPAAVTPVTDTDEMMAAHLRRMADYRPVDMTGISPRRDLPIRNRKHSVRHRALR
jgi:hypothetical protein